MAKEHGVQKRREIGKRLVLTRKALDLKQAQLARYMGVSPQSLNNYERGYRLFDLDLAEAMCERSQLTLDWLYRGEIGTPPQRLIQKIDAQQSKAKRQFAHSVIYTHTV